MAKMALCIQLIDAPQNVIDVYENSGKVQLVPIEASFFNTTTSLEDRATCETDESMLQLLPYLNLQVEDGRMFTYTRGGSGEEARLHGNFSVGIGGHVDISPDWDESLLHLLKEECAREGAEEAGLELDLDRVTFSHFIVDGSNPVGRVHLGLLCTYTLTTAEADALDFSAEADIIDSGRLETLDNLGVNENYTRLENWSKAVVCRAEAVRLESALDEVE